MRSLFSSIRIKASVIQIVVKYALILSLIVTSFYCAGQQAPSGGPPDTTPPKIIATYPSAGTLRYHDNKFSFSFSKYIERRSLQESFFVSPSLGQFTYEWDGTDVEIFFTDSLRSNTTYIVTLGTDVIDTRKNRLAEAFSLPFSTGDRIDSGSIAGTVIDDKPVGVMIFAYELEGRNPDTLNPTKLKPDFLTQTGKDGSFILPYMAFGKYRLFAVRDEYKNLLYDVQTDRYGVWNSDILLSSQTPMVTGIQFKLTVEDTSAPFLSSAKPIDNSHLLLKFSEAMNVATAYIDSISILDTLTGNSLPVYDLSFDNVTSKDAQLVTGRQDSGKTYRIKLSGLRDINNNLMQSPLNIGIFNASTEPDTTIPTFEIKGITNNAKNISIEESLHVVFSEAINKKSFEMGLSQEDSLGKKVDGKFLWNSSREGYFIPASLLTMGMQYTIKITMDSVIDYSGNAKKDSTISRRFETVDEKVLSSINGIVADEVKNANGKIYLSAVNLNRKDFNPKMIQLDSLGQFKFERLLDGKYILSGFRDSDSNGVYTFGKPFPYLSAERFTNFPDTLKLRARWPLEGVMIRFK